MSVEIVDSKEGPWKMKRFLNRRTAVVLMLCLLAVTAAPSASAQTPDETTEAEQSDQELSWKTLLNLTPDQVSKIREIRRANRLEWQAARQRVRQARRALDQAIYSDDASEALIEQRAREVAEAQAAEVRLRALTELGIRRILTPEQLNIFRTVRERRLRAAGARRRPGARIRALGGDRLEGPAGEAPARRNRPLLGPRRRRGLLPGRIRP